MNQATRIALASAAVVAVAVIGIALFQDQDVAGPGQTGPTPPSTAAPAVETTLPSSGLLPPGTYVIDDPFPVRVSMDLDEGWNVWSGIAPDAAAIYQDGTNSPDGHGIILAIVENLSADPCDMLSGGLQPPLGSTVDDLASGLASQPATEVSETTEVTIDGYSGTYLEYTMTGGGEGCPTRIRRWQTSVGPREAILNEHDQVWILDVDGVRLVIDAFSFPGTPDARLAELQQVVESMRIDSGGAGG
jgi:hypothetical protein